MKFLSPVWTLYAPFLLCTFTIVIVHYVLLVSAKHATALYNYSYTVCLAVCAFCVRAFDFQNVPNSVCGTTHRLMWNLCKPK